MLGVKLVESQLAALAAPGAKPMGYGLGKAGWAIVPLHGRPPPAAVLRDWILESYCLVAPKKLIARVVAERP